MALFKPFMGSRASLDAQEKHAGYAYFCTDDGSFHIDYIDANGVLQRKQISAKDAETLGLHTIDEFLLKTEWAQPDWNQTDATKPDYIKNKPKTGAIFSTSIVGSIFMLEQIGAIYAGSIIDDVLIIE